MDLYVTVFEFWWSIVSRKSSVVNVSLLLLIIKTFNWNNKCTVMEMALIEIFCSYYVYKLKNAFLLTFITTFQGNT